MPHKLGHIPIQTQETPEKQPALATSWAALLPLLFKCWKEHQEKEEEISLMFWIMCPWSPPRSQLEIAWITERASDSTRTWEIPKSKVSSTPSYSARDSVIAAKKDAGRILFEAAMRKPRLSRITTSMQEGLPSSKAAPSTFTLKNPTRGASQGEGAGDRVNIGREQATLNSPKILFAITQTCIGGVPESYKA